VVYFSIKASLIFHTRNKSENSGARKIYGPGRKNRSGHFMGMAFRLQKAASSMLAA
jgi:hypothetical protein